MTTSVNTHQVLFISTLSCHSVKLRTCSLTQSNDVKAKADISVIKLHCFVYLFFLQKCTEVHVEKNFSLEISPNCCFVDVNASTLSYTQHLQLGESPVVRYMCKGELHKKNKAK